MIKKDSVRWYIRTYASKMILFSSLLIAGIVGVQTSIFIRTETTYLQDRLIEDKKSLAELLAINLGVAQTVAGFAFQSNLIKETGETSDTVYVRFVKPNGEIYLSNIVEERGTVIRDSAINTDKIVVKDDLYKGENIKVVVSPISRGYTVWLGFSLHRVHATVNKRVRDILLVSLAILISVNFIAYFIAKRITYPLKELRKGVEAIGKGKLDYKVDVKSQDEIGELAEAFNKMAGRVKVSIDTEAAARKETENIMNTMVETLIVVDSEGNIRKANKAIFELLGYKENELIGKPFNRLLGQNQKEAEEKLERLIKKGVVKDFELTYLTKDERQIPVSFSASSMKGENRELKGFVCVAADITEHRKAEQALAKERNLLHLLMDNIPDWIFFKDSGSRFTRINRAHAQLLGVADPQEAAGKTDFDFFPREDAQRFYDEEQKITQSGEPVIARVGQTPNRDGEMTWVSETKIPLHAETGEVVGLVGISRDITELKQAEAKLKQTLAELGRSNAELEQFAYVTSHDLQEPLRMVSSYLQLLERRYKERLDSDADEFIAYAVDGATRMHKMINDLLDYSRVTTRGKPFEPTNCEVVLDRSLDNLRMMIEESGTVVTHSPLPTVMTDDVQLVQLFQNLIGNAIKFRGEEPPRVYVSAEQKSNEWVFSVCDNGIGIDLEYAERIFRIFQRLHSRTEYPGTGIGLAVCKRIVERHGGRIWVESQPGEGSTFYFTIPIKE